MGILKSIRGLFKANKSGIELRREPRLRLATGKVGFIYSGGQELAIHNISVTGIAFKLDSFEKEPEAGDLIQGKLFAGNRSMEIECVVVHLSGPYVGCEFKEYTEDLKLMLRQRFQSELKAHSLVKVKPEILNAHEEGTPYYYHGGHQDQLFFVVNESGMLYFYFSFNGNYMEGGIEKPLKSGRMKVEPQEVAQGQEMNFMIEMDKTLSAEKIEVARDYLLNIDHLDQHHLRQIFAFLGLVNEQ